MAEVKIFHATMRALRAGIRDVSWWVYPVSALAGAVLGALLALIRGRRPGDDPPAPDDGGGGITVLIIGIVFVAVLIAAVVFAVRINRKGTAQRFDRAYGRYATRVDGQQADNELVERSSDPGRRDSVSDADRAKAVEISERQVTSLVPATFGILVAVPFYLAALFVTAHLLFDDGGGRVMSFSALTIVFGFSFVQLGRARLVLEQEGHVPPAPAVDE